MQLLLARAELAGGEAAAGRDRLTRLAVQHPEDAGVLFRLAVALFDERAKASEPNRGLLTHRVETLLDKVLTLEPRNTAASQLLTALKTG